MRRLGPCVACALVLVVPGSATARGRVHHHLARRSSGWATAPFGISPTTTFTVINNGVPVDGYRLVQIEAALITQSLELRAAWGTPAAGFVATGGIPVRLEPGLALPQDPAVAGGHLANPTRIVIGANGRSETTWTRTLSHEVIETLVDPGANGYEVCDPVNGNDYAVNGVSVSDFMLPNGHDYMGVS